MIGIFILLCTVLLKHEEAYATVSPGRNPCRIEALTFCEEGSSLIAATECLARADSSGLTSLECSFFLANHYLSDCISDVKNHCENWKAFSRISDVSDCLSVVDEAALSTTCRASIESVTAASQELELFRQQQEAKNVLVAFLSYLGAPRSPSSLAASFAFYSASPATVVTIYSASSRVDMSNEIEFRAAPALAHTSESNSNSETPEPSAEQSSSDDILSHYLLYLLGSFLALILASAICRPCVNKQQNVSGEKDEEAPYFSLADNPNEIQVA